VEQVRPAGWDRGGDEDVAGVEQGQDRRGEAAVEDVGLVVALGRPVDGVHQRDVAGGLDRVVALEVLEVEEDGAVV
jgi:hypothetical protein